MAYDAEVRVNTKINLSDFKKMNKEVERLEKKFEDLKRKGDINEELGIKATSRTMRRLDIDTENTYNALQKARRELEAMSEQGIEEVSTGGKKASDVLKNFSKRILGLAKRVFVFSLIAKGFRAMVSAIQDGLKNLAQFSDEYNSAMSSFKSQTEQLKNSLATAFAPIITAILPYLTKLVEWLNIGAEAVAKFFAVLSGKNMYAKATSQVVDYAKGLKEVNKEANKLASFDDINVLQKDEGSSGTSTGANAFEMAEVDESKFGWVVWLRDNLELVKTVVKDIGILLGLWGISKVLSTDLGSIAIGIGLIVGGVISAISIVKEWIATGEITDKQLNVLMVSILAIGAGLALLTGSWIPLLIGAIGALVALIVAKADKIWGAIKGAWQKIKDFTSKTWTSVKNGVLGAFEGIWSGIKKVINWIVQGVAKMVNGIIGFINKMIDGINSIGFDVPEWLGGGHVGFDIKRLNEVQWKGLALAQGGITNRPTTALIGEAGREAVLPLENNTEWMDVLADKIGGGTVTLKFDGDLAQLARVLNPVLANESKRIGTRLVVE